MYEQKQFYTNNIKLLLLYIKRCKHLINHLHTTRKVFLLRKNKKHYLTFQRFLLHLHALFKER